MVTVKKKIELYVSENAGSNTKTTGYYRIPLKGDSLPFNKETNLFKNCIRFYAKVAGDIVYYVSISKLPYYVSVNNGGRNDQYGRNIVKGSISDELFANTVPQFPLELINNNESHIITNLLGTVFSSKEGFVQLNTGTESTYVEVSRDSLFNLSNAIISDEYLNLLEFVPSNWVRLNSIDDIVNEINSFMNTDNEIDYPYDIEDTKIFRYYTISNPRELEISYGNKSIIATNKEPNLEAGVSKANLSNGKDARYLIMPIPGDCSCFNIDTTEMSGKVRLVVEEFSNIFNTQFDKSKVVNPGETVQYTFTFSDYNILQIVFENPSDATKLKITRTKFDLIPGKTFETASQEDINAVAEMISQSGLSMTHLTEYSTIPSTNTIMGTDNVMALRGGQINSNQKVTITDISTDSNFAKAYIVDRFLRSVMKSTEILNKTNVDSELDQLTTYLGRDDKYLIIVKDPAVTFNVKTISIPE